MAKLKEMKLLTGKDLNKVKFPGVIKHEHIYNDYHERQTNPGFSRNEKGKFYTKWLLISSLQRISTDNIHSIELIMTNILISMKSWS